MIWLIRNIILALHSEKSRWQLALGAVMGWHLGMIPMDNGVWYAFLTLTLLLRANLGLAVVFGLLGHSLVFSYDVSSWGRAVLEHESFVSLWTQFYNTPILAMSGFNRVDVMGGWVCALCISVLTFPILIQIAKVYQRYVLVFLEKFWLIKMLKGSKLFQWYMRVVG